MIEMNAQKKWGLALVAALVLLLYLPARLRWKRYVGAIALALPGAAGDPAFEQYLARRACDALPWDSLRAITPDPWGDIGRGQCRALADAELGELHAVLERDRQVVAHP